MGSRAVLQVQYTQCSLPTTVSSVPRPSYLQFIQASPTRMRNYGRDSSLHAAESSKSPNVNHLEDYHVEDKEEDGTESEFVAESASPDATISTT